MDFSNVPEPFQNKLDRTKSSRMGWSDIALSFHGPSVEDLRHHFIERWNFIYDEKYNVRKDVRYSRIGGPSNQATGHLAPTAAVPAYQTPQAQQTGSFPPPPGSQPYTAPAWQSTSRPHTPNTQAQDTHAQQQPFGSNTGYGGHQNFPPPPPGPPPLGQPQNITHQSYDQQYPAHPQQAQQGGYAGQPQYQAGHHPENQQGYQNKPPSPSQQAPEHYVPPGSAQSHPQYTPYGGGGAVGGQPGQQPYEHHSYQAPPGSSTRGFDDNQGYGESDRGFYGKDPSYEGQRGFGDNYSSDRGMSSRIGQYKQEGKRLEQELTSLGKFVTGEFHNKAHQYTGKYFGGSSPQQRYGPMEVQVLRSCTKWSNGTPTEKSIQNAYIDVIEKSQHFVYIENQFFITATGDKQKPVKNLIGKALVDRILRAARNGEKYKVIVVIPAVPAFAGDLRDDGSLGTRAIMEFQYFSINRGGNSIMELIAQAGFNPLDYIRFYNLRNYDRINAGRTMSQVEQQSGISYEDARKQHDDLVGAGYAGQGEGTGIHPGGQAPQYHQYQAAAQPYPKTAGGRWDSVAECYMLGGEDILTVPWDGTPESELDAFVSEELYIHSKVCLSLSGTW
jgi:phospholipase D1/2